MTRTAIRIGAVAMATLLLAACGSSRGERAVSGGGIGAAGGAALTALTGGSILAGAAIGGAVGAATGALTDHHDINLGKPAWK